MGTTKDMSGQVYNNLTVIKFSRIKNKNSHWICECMLCGNEFEASRPNIRSGNTCDCGCMRSEKISNNTKKHGHTKSPTYSSWMKLRQRIKTKKNSTYSNISYDPRWDSFELFLEDMGPRPEGKTIDRIDNTKGYYKENCRWASHSEQCRNRSTNVILTHNGMTMCAIDWASFLGIHRDTIRRRIRRGLPTEDVLKKTA